MAFLTKGNELLNDHTARQKTQGEIKKLEADAEHTKALARKVDVEAQTIKIENDKMPLWHNKDKSENPCIARLKGNKELLPQRAV